MSTNITIDASIAYNDGVVADSIELANFTYTTSTDFQARLMQSVPTTAGGTALTLGGLASLGWCMLLNHDANNYVTVLTGSSGTVIGKIPPGGCWGPNYMGSGLQAPYLLANTAACLVEAFLSAQ